MREGRVWVGVVWETVCWGSPSVGERGRIRYMKLQRRGALHTYDLVVVAASDVAGGGGRAEKLMP